MAKPKTHPLGVDLREFMDFLLACAPELAPELPSLLRQWGHSQTAQAFGVTGGELVVSGQPPKAQTAFVELRNRAKGETAWFPSDKLVDFVLERSRVPREKREDLLLRMKQAWLKKPEKFRKLEVRER